MSEDEEAVVSRIVSQAIVSEDVAIGVYCQLGGIIRLIQIQKQNRREPTDEEVAAASAATLEFERIIQQLCTVETEH